MPRGTAKRKGRNVETGGSSEVIEHRRNVERVESQGVPEDEEITLERCQEIIKRVRKQGVKQTPPLTLFNEAVPVTRYARENFDENTGDLFYYLFSELRTAYRGFRDNRGSSRDYVDQGAERFYNYANSMICPDQTNTAPQVEEQHYGSSEQRPSDAGGYSDIVPSSSQSASISRAYREVNMGINSVFKDVGDIANEHFSRTQQAIIAAAELAIKRAGNGKALFVGPSKFWGIPVEYIIERFEKGSVFADLDKHTVKQGIKEKVSPELRKLQDPQTPEEDVTGVAVVYRARMKEALQISISEDEFMGLASDIDIDIGSNASKYLPNLGKGFVFVGSHLLTENLAGEIENLVLDDAEKLGKEKFYRTYMGSITHKWWVDRIIDAHFQLLENSVASKGVIYYSRPHEGVARTFSGLEFEQSLVRHDAEARLKSRFKEVDRQTWQLDRTPRTAAIYQKSAIMLSVEQFEQVRNTVVSVSSEIVASTLVLKPMADIPAQEEYDPQQPGGLGAPEVSQVPYGAGASGFHKVGRRMQDLSLQTTSSYRGPDTFGSTVGASGASPYNVQSSSEIPATLPVAFPPTTYLRKLSSLLPPSSGLGFETQGTMHSASENSPYNTQYHLTEKSLPVPENLDYPTASWAGPPGGSHEHFEEEYLDTSDQEQPDAKSAVPLFSEIPATLPVAFPPTTYSRDSSSLLPPSSGLGFGAQGTLHSASGANLYNTQYYSTEGSPPARETYPYNVQSSSKIPVTRPAAFPATTYSQDFSSLSPPSSGLEFGAQGTLHSASGANLYNTQYYSTEGSLPAPETFDSSASWAGPPGGSHEHFEEEYLDTSDQDQPDAKSAVPQEDTFDSRAPKESNKPKKEKSRKKKKRRGLW